jgi:pimeloyl-ACP methyl ester carboxylesterase
MQEPLSRPRAASLSDHHYRGDRFRVARWRAETPRPARPLLFFTGIGANIELLAPFLEQLGGRDVVTMDILGLGGSSESRQPYRLSAMAEAAKHVVSELGYDEIDVMGVSWGGMLAQEFAYRHRRTVKRLVLAATSPGMPTIPGNLVSLVKMVLPHRYAASGAIETFLQGLYGGSTRGLGDYAARIRPPSSQGYLHQLLAIVGWTSVRKLTRVSAETLIVMGAEDRLVPPVNGQILKFLLNNARLEVLENAGHLFLLTHRDEVADKIERFLGGAATPSIPARPADPVGLLPAGGAARA